MCKEMIKVSFITVHVGFNFGSKLQAIATSEVLKKLGYLPICVNYVPSRVTYKRYWQTSFSSILKFLRRFLFFPSLPSEAPVINSISDGKVKESVELTIIDNNKTIIKPLFWVYTIKSFLR